MPYSVNSDVNQENARTPSPIISLNEQFIYRLASLESTLREGLKHLEDKFDTLNKDTVQRRQELAKELEIFKAEVHVESGVVSARIGVLEKWQNAMTVRFSVVLAIVIAFWAVFGEAIRSVLGLHNG